VCFLGAKVVCAFPPGCSAKPGPACNPAKPLGRVSLRPRSVAGRQHRAEGEWGLVDAALPVADMAVGAGRDYLLRMNRQTRAVLWASGTAVVGALGWAGWRLFQEKHLEAPEYRVLSVKDGVELREYAPTLVAVTEVEGEFNASLNEGFRRIAGYIFGGNRGKQSISMTAPVGLQRASDSEPGERIAMTAPVGLQRSGPVWRVTFVMPSEYTLETLPEPVDARVRLETVPGKRVAVRSFSGSASESVAKAEQARLLEDLREQGLRPVGEPVLAQYNSLLMPPFLRRNEILVDVQAVEPVH
jgi:SOUL heme-binding protein